MEHDMFRQRPLFFGSPQRRVSFHKVNVSPAGLRVGESLVPMHLNYSPTNHLKVPAHAVPARIRNVRWIYLDRQRSLCAVCEILKPHEQRGETRRSLEGNSILHRREDLVGGPFPMPCCIYAPEMAARRMGTFACVSDRQAPVGVLRRRWE